MCSDKDDNDWTVQEDAANSTEASVTINLGCMKKVKEIRLKNIKKEKGGTKTFTIYLSDSIEGPWRQIWTDEFSEKTTYGCAARQTIDLEYVLFINLFVLSPLFTLVDESSMVTF